jgi:hypothetical protein
VSQSFDPEFDGLVSRTREPYNEAQMTMLAYGALRFLKRRWFYGLIEPTPDQYMAALLISVYHTANFGRPINRKGASIEMGVDDLKTARKYMKRAEELGLIVIQQSPTDKRMELLSPTAKLNAVARKELELFATEIFRSMFEITNMDAYSVGVGRDHPAIRPVNPDWVRTAKEKERTALRARLKARKARRKSLKADDTKPGRGR